MSESLKEVHKKFAVDCFNGTWDLLDNKDRSREEDFNMIHMAHASRYHWGEIGTPLEFARGDWQISRVYAVLGMGAMAINSEIHERFFTRSPIWTLPYDTTDFSTTSIPSSTRSRP